MDQSKEERKRGESKETVEEKTLQRQPSAKAVTDDDNMSQSSNSPPLPPASATMTPTSHPQSPLLYMSSASSSSKSNMLTIDTVGDTRTQKSEFFVAYDSDTSGSSFIRQQQQAELSTSSSFGSGTSSNRTRRDRFPSFDSHTSQGSIRYVSPRSQPKPSHQLSNPRFMPYHERKKLQKQQQQQQQQQQNLKQPPNQQQVPQVPFPPNMMMMMPPPPHGHMPYGNAMDPQAAAAAFYAIYGFPPPGFPMPQQPHHEQPQHPFPPGFMMPPPPLPQGGQPQQQRGAAPPNGPLMQPYPMPFYPPPNLPQHFPQHHQSQHQQHAQAPRRSSHHSNSSRDRLARGNPKAPPSAKPHHVRGDSYGSMSSLGSAGGDSESERSAHRRNSGSSGSGFFADMFAKNNPNANAAAAAAPSPFTRPMVNPRSSGGSNAAASASPRSSLHRRVGSQDRPPASRGTLKRLPSISNDEWGEGSGEDRDTIEGGKKYVPNSVVDENSSFSEYSSSDATSEDVEANERTSLLPPSGISTNEQEAANDSRKNRASGVYNSTSDRHYGRSSRISDSDPNQSSRRRAGSDIQYDSIGKKTARKNRRKKKKSRRRSGNRNADSSNSDTSDSSYDYRRWTMKRAKMLEREREQVHKQWKAEYLAETERVRHEKEQQRPHRRFFRWLASLWEKGFRFITTIEIFISNLPAAIGAIALAVAILGVVWFKFTEENLETCERVHFHSSQCTFPEFPGCFYCDTTVPMYQVAVNFHYGCNVVAGILAFLFVAKVLLATRVVIDEMASPVTASPAGLVCMTTVCVFAGRGLIGQIMVSLAASAHLGLVIWYIYMALAYQIMPEPTWFPNTIGIGLTAVKTWLYYPMPGHLLMAISLSLNIFFFPISLIRVAINEKISATVGWMQMSAPAVSLYALTIMAQPSFEEENPDVTNFQRVHRMIYLPCMHFMCLLSLIGFFASCHSLWSRWDDLKKRTFSPAHSAFCFPTLSHANAIQSYRGAVLTFSEVKPHDWRLIILYAYWFVVLLGGTIATFWISTKFLYNLPVWTNLDLADEEEPPAPSETILSLQEMITAGETMRQPFVSPAVLQANETGALVATRTGPEGRLKYVRTRRLPALGFEPTMKWSEMQKEREVLLEWVGKNPPRRRHRTLSVPGIDFSYGSASSSSLGTDNRGIYGGYGSFSPLPPARRSRADTGW